MYITSSFPPLSLSLSLLLCTLPLLFPPLSLSPLSPQDVGMPAEYVNKLARMFQDIKVSDDLNIEFKDKNKGSDTAGNVT